MNKQVANFLGFIREKGVVGLAVGLAIGTQVNAFVSTIVKGLIDPLIGLIVGNQAGLQAAKFTVTIAHRKADFLWGSVLSALIVLLAVAAVIYYVVMGLKLDRADKKKDA